MATNFVALALLVITSSVGKPRSEKKLVFSAEKLASAYVCIRRIVALYDQMAREAEDVHSFFRCVIAKCMYQVMRDVKLWKAEDSCTQS